MTTVPHPSRTLHLSNLHCQPRLRHSAILLIFWIATSLSVAGCLAAPLHIHQASLSPLETVSPASQTSSARYVDAAAAAGGDGLSWATAWRTIQSAADAQLPAGSIVYIRPGIYHETVAITGSGAQVIPMQTGVSVNAEVVTFPSETDLSLVDLNAHPGEYYLYLARSLQGNHGVFKIVAVNAAEHSVRVEGAQFSAESGIKGDLTRLSAAIGRPVIYRNAHPELGRVTLHAGSLSNACTVLYIGGYLDPYHANAANFNLLDGIDVSGSPQCGGIHIQNSSFNVIRNSRIYDHQGVGVLIAGSNVAARYNYLISNQIWNTPNEGVYVGAGGHGEQYNQAHHNHIVDNEIFVQGNASNARLENAVDIKEYNQGNVIAGNLIRDIDLITDGNGAVDIRPQANHTLVYGNTLRNIGRGAASGTFYVVNLYPQTSGVLIYNNLIYRTTPRRDGVFAINLHANQTTAILVAHNTIDQMDAGLLLQYSTPGGDGSDNGVTVANNLLARIGETLIEEWTWDAASEGTFDVHHNVFPSQPENYPAPSAFIGAAIFVDATAGDYRLAAQSLGVDQGVPLQPSIQRDFLLKPRDELPDIGAFESVQQLFLPLLLR